MFTNLVARIKVSAFARQLFWLMLLFAIAVGNFAVYVAAEKHIDRANEMRLQAVKLAHELRQSSDDLTRMVRTYVLTGKPLYKAHYQEILDIRNGVQARPEDYQGVYWDLVLDDDVRPTARSAVQKPLLELMREAGFTAREFELLAEAKANSDALTAIEFEAMRLSEHIDAEAEELWQRARLLLYSAKYHQAKAAIMRPIAEFERLAAQRNDAAVAHATQVALLFRIVMILLIVALMASLRRTYQALRLTLGGSVETVKSRIDQIAQGDFGKAGALKQSDDNVLGWLTEMQNKLLESQAQQARLAERLYSEKERAQVTLSCIGDAVITTDALGRVTFLNQVAIDLTGWPLTEALNKPLTEIFNIVNEATRKPVLNPVHQVLNEGKTVLLANHTVLIARDGKEYNIEDSAAPIRLENGDLLGCVLVFHDVTEKHHLLRDVRWQAGHDVLTGLPNRALLADRFERALIHARRHGEELVVCLLDLDDFKPVNDLHGHVVGDQLLVEAARRLSALLRADDTVARLGGDEFVLLLGGAHGPDEARHTLQRVIDVMVQPYFIDGNTILVSASIGAVVYPDDDADSDTLLRHADQAMYAAKQSGRNRYRFFDVLHDRELQDTHQQLEELRRALVNHELCLYYQPKVNLRGGEVVGVEALLRWQHPQRGLLSPADFLRVAEDTDLIVAIGEWVLGQAMGQMARWRAHNHNWPVSVNISARHFGNPDFYERLKFILAQTPQVPPQSLYIEILESVAVRNIEQVRVLIEQCQSLGVRFALDDFGTGYSSLSYLKHLPVEVLKIDQSFVRDMLEDKEDMALVEAIISLSRVFDCMVIAEGVESVAQGILLLRLGCDVVQGYAIARPMAAEQLPIWHERYTLDPEWYKWADVQWPMQDVPLLVAAHEHSKWVEGIAAALDNPELRLAAGQLLDHHACRFGQWYDGAGTARYAHLREFGRLGEAHMQVHRLGMEIVRLRDAGDLHAARELMRDLQAGKDAILAELSGLQAALGPAKK